MIVAWTTRRGIDQHAHAAPNACQLIRNIVAQEIFAVMQREEVYNEQRYIAALRGLPESVI
jgi:hypothetical protein